MQSSQHPEFDHAGVSVFLYRSDNLDSYPSTFRAIVCLDNLTEGTLPKKLVDEIAASQFRVRNDHVVSFRIVVGSACEIRQDVGFFAQNDLLVLLLRPCMSTIGGTMLRCSISSMAALGRLITIIIIMIPLSLCVCRPVRYDICRCGGDKRTIIRACIVGRIQWICVLHLTTRGCQRHHVRRRITSAEAVAIWIILSHRSSRDRLLNGPIARTNITCSVGMNSRGCRQPSPFVHCTSCVIGRGFVIVTTFWTGGVPDDYHLLLLGVPSTRSRPVASCVIVFVPVDHRSSFNATILVSTSGPMLGDKGRHTKPFGGDRCARFPFGTCS